MRVRLNVATKALETHRRFLAGSGLIVVVAGLIFLGLGWHVYSVRKVDAELRARTEKSRLKMAELEAQRQDLDRFFHLDENAKLNDRAAFINGIIDARSFNWTQMFMDLERILPAGVHVVSIEPKQSKGQVEVKLILGAANDEAELNFLHALEHSKEFTQVQVQYVRQPSSQTGSFTGDQKVVQLTTVYLRG